MDEKRQAAAKKLLEAAHEFWSACLAEGQGGAVQWLTDTDGAMVIFTRGEYRRQLLDNIWTLTDQNRIHCFAEEMPSDDEED